MAHTLRDRYAMTSMALGALGSAFAFVLVLRAVFPQLALGRGFADAVEPGIHAAMILLLLGAALCLRAFPDTHRPAQAAASLLALAAGLYSVLALWRALAGPDAAATLPGFLAGGSLQAARTHSISPNGGVAFMACAAALWCAAPMRRPRHRRAGRMALALLATVATLGLAGHLMALELLYRVASHNQVPMSTAVALLVLGAGIWQLRDRVPVDRTRDPQWLERRITYRAITALTLVAVGGGIAGFVAMRETFEKSVLQAMEQSARTYALALDDALRSSLALSAAAGDGPALAQAMARLNAAPRDTQASEQLDAQTADFLVGGVDGVRFLDARGHLLRSAGLFLGDSARSIEPLDMDGSQHAELRWNAGYVLRTLVPVRQGGAVVGQVVMEQKLRLFDRLMDQMRRSTESADAVICSRRADVAACAPSRLYTAPFTVPLWTAAGKPSLPISLALLGQSGVSYARDLRGVPVAAGYSPIGSYGLGLVLKTDVTTLYAPLRGQLHLIALSVLGLVAAGTWALRGRVQPLLATLVQEQQRTADILGTAGDAFIAVGADGRVTDWNPEAARMFGWSAAEAIGRDMVALIGPRIPPHAPLTAHAQLLDLGRSLAAGRPAELLGRHRNGTEVPVEMMMAVQSTASGPVANAFLRDIRARREAEQRLARTEQRLRDVLCNLPAVVCHFDARQRCLFANDYALQSRGLIERPQVGLYAQELLGDVQYALHLPYLLEALAGRRAQFEGCVDHEGTPRHLQSHLIPEFDAGAGAGGDPPAVVGFYLMSFDVTALKELQLRHERTERRLRAIADNLPVMITYIDRAHRLQFLNHTFEEWTGLPIEHALGKPLPEVIGPALYAQRADPLRRALSGQRVQFEVESEALGIRRILQTDYIPDMLAVGEVLGIYTLTTDVTAIRQSERRMKELAMTDTLTGLANRRQFDIHLAAALQASQVSGTGMALMFLDIDHFKAINDTWGHAAGDAALITMAERLREAVRSTDFPARIAGDEFAVVLPHLSSCDEAQTVADKVLHAIREPMPMQHHHMPRQMTTSVGVAYLAPGEQPVRPTDLLLAADRALYAAKHGGRNACAVHVVDLRELG